MGVYEPRELARAEANLEKIRFHFSKRIGRGEEFTKEDTIALLVNTFYEKSEEEIELSIKLNR